MTPSGQIALLSPLTSVAETMTPTAPLPDTEAIRELLGMMKANLGTLYVPSRAQSCQGSVH